ncbi:hypothetical protein DL771_001640 [Monosporascus sp. 5C6A]|nr:hypothetical protein DL771_001640 [Monosporascus sp. 5C6A]
MVGSRLSQTRDAQADLFASMTDEENLDGEKPLPQSEIFQKAVFFVPAGADISSAAICATLFYLARHRSVYDRLVDEIRSTLASGANISGGPKLTGCQCLRSCIDECMSPPVGGTLWREQQASSKEAGEPLTVQGHVIPPGTQVGVSIYALHHNERYFPAPFAYTPERWLASEMSQDERKLTHDAFAAFSLGPRSCPGKAMAYLEMSLVIAKLIWYFDFAAAPGHFGEGGGRKSRTVRNSDDATIATPHLPIQASVALSGAALRRLRTRHPWTSTICMILRRLLALSIVADSCPNSHAVSPSLQAVLSSKPPRAALVVAMTCACMARARARVQRLRDLAREPHARHRRLLARRGPGSGCRWPSTSRSAAAFLFGPLGAVLGMVRAWYVGTVVRLCGAAESGGDGGFEPGFACAALSYLGFKEIEKTYFGG